MNEFEQLRTQLFDVKMKLFLLAKEADNPLQQEKIAEEKQKQAEIRHKMAKYKMEEIEKERGKLK